MRKVLLATTALVGFAVAGAAQAATSPLTVTVGGDVDFLAGAYHSAAKVVSSSTDQTGHDFETLYALNFGVTGKSGNGLEYGGNLSLNNNPDISNYFGGNGNGIEVTNANLFLSGAFGKVVLGDSHGATDLALLAPVVGEGQVYGRYIDFLNTTTFAKNFVAGVDSTDHSTNITYLTPKVGNDTNKVQLGVTFEPNFYNYGSNSVQYTNASNPAGYGKDKLSPYQDVVKGAVAYTGNFRPVAVGVSADVITGNADAHNTTDAYNWIWNAPAGKVRDFTAFGVGAQAAAEGFTLGANYLDQGHYDTVAGQNKDQHQVGAALKYEFNKVGVGVSYLGGEGYSNLLSLPTGAGTGSNYDYVKDFTSYGAGGTYTWAPGLTSNLDGVLFGQKTEAGSKNDGYVLLVSQKLAF
jgi:hypothetical protein